MYGFDKNSMRYKANNPDSFLRHCNKTLQTSRIQVSCIVMLASSFQCAHINNCVKFMSCEKCMTFTPLSNSVRLPDWMITQVKWTTLAKRSFMYSGVFSIHDLKKLGSSVAKSSRT